MTRKEGSRRGFILAAALLSILFIAALMAAVFFATTEETRVTVATTASDNALTEAESAVNSALESIDGGLSAVPGPGGMETISDATGRSSVYVTRLDSTLLWVVGEAYGDRSLSGTARRVGVFAAVVIDSTGSIRVSRIPGRGWSELF